MAPALTPTVSQPVADWWTNKQKSGAQGIIKRFRHLRSPYMHGSWFKFGRTEVIRGAEVSDLDLDKDRLRFKRVEFCSTLSKSLYLESWARACWDLSRFVKKYVCIFFNRHFRTKIKEEEKTQEMHAAFYLEGKIVHDAFFSKLLYVCQPPIPQIGKRCLSPIQDAIGYTNNVYCLFSESQSD